MATNVAGIISNSDRQLAGGNAPVQKLHKVDYDALVGIATTTNTANTATINAISATNELATVSTLYKSFFVNKFIIPPERNMVVDGSVTPVEFTLERNIPSSTRLVGWEISLYLQSGGNLVPTGFGSDNNPLTNGIELKHDNFVIENWKTIYHLTMDYNKEEADFIVNNKRNLNGVFSLQTAGNIRGYSIAFDADFRIIIQDDMTTVAKNLSALYFQIKGNLEAL